MGTAEEELKLRLTNHTGVNALVSGRIYPVKLPQNPTYPAITYLLITDENNSAMGQDIADVRARFQFSAWDTSYSGAKALAKQIKNALKRYSVNPGTYVPIQDIFTDGEHDLYDDDAQVYQVVRDFEVNYLES